MILGFLWALLMNLATIGIIALFLFVLIRIVNPHSALDYWKVFLCVWFVSIFAWLIIRAIGVTQYYDRV